MKTNIILSASIAAVIALLVGIGFKISAPASSQDSSQFGSLTSNVITSRFLSWGGVETYNYRQTMTTGASTTCAFQTPAATTSLVFVGARFTFASSTSAVDAEWGKSTSIDATTTSLGHNASIGANTPATFIGSSTPAYPETDGRTVFGPSQWLNLKIGSVGPGASPSGTCVASFIRI